MGYGRRKRTRRENGQESVPYGTISKSSELFEKYYSAQQIVTPDEFGRLLQCLRDPLPTTFRITGDEKCIKTVGERFLRLIDAIKAKYPDECDVTELKWYPFASAWQVNVGRYECKKRPELLKLKQFFVQHSELGLIRRQELVSMLPALLLDVEPHHKVLDMCAAPGSKTSQLLEYLHMKRDVCPDGFLIANDLDRNRTYTLSHQLRNLHSPNVAVVNHDAGLFPNIRFKCIDDLNGENDDQYEELQFDRILCDVPCTGDGTLRKAPEIWERWNPVKAYNMHGIQFRIAQRAVELLKPGGIMVYSTCSLNPVENEAVVERLLLKNQGKIQLLDVTIDGVVLRPGLKSWVLMSKGGDILTGPDQVTEALKSTIKPWMFATGESDVLERSKRIVPLDQNSGGFFIALFKKISNIAQDESSSTLISKRIGRNRQKELREESPFVFIHRDSVPADINTIRSDFKMESLPVEQLMIRRYSDTPNNVYFVSRSLKNIILLNADRVQLINAGVRIFTRTNFGQDPMVGQDSSLRFCDSGLPIALKYCENRVVPISRDDLLVLLKNVLPARRLLSEETQRRLNFRGCVILLHEPDDECPVNASVVAVSTADYVRPFVSKQNRYTLLSLLTSAEEADEVVRHVHEEEVKLTSVTKDVKV